MAAARFNAGLSAIINFHSRINLKPFELLRLQKIDL